MGFELNKPLFSSGTAGHMDIVRRDRRNTDGVLMRWALLFLA